MRHTLIAFTVVAFLAADACCTELRTEELMHALQAGGYTILVRHARTDRSAPNKETPGTVPPLRSDQRNLTADGERDVRLMRSVVERYNLPISEVISSPSYRCRETADAFGPAAVDMTLRAFPTTDATAALLAAAPRAGTNRVLVTHHFVIENHVPGISVGDIGESEAAVVRRAGDRSVELVGKIKLADWEALAPDEKAAPTSAANAGPKAVAPSAAALHQTPLVQMAAAYLEAFNSGDRERMRAFIESSFLAVPDRPTEKRLQTYATLFEQHGPLTVTGLQSASEEKVALQARSKRGDLILTMTASADAGRLQSVTFGLLHRGGGGH